MTTWKRSPIPPRGGLTGTLCLLIATCLSARAAGAQDPFVDAVVSFTQGTAGGFGAASLPDIVLGPPRGGGATQGSFDVVSLGSGGSIVLRFDLPVICDGPGADLTVFENAFHVGSPAGAVFTEYGFVAVSQDGVQFLEFPSNPITHAGLAGQTPVLSNPDNGIDPLDPSVSGGDQFDLASVGLTWAAYVRITDVAGAIPDTGDLPQFAIPPNAGFDLDAVAALHACDPGSAASPTPSATPSPTAPVPTATSTATATGTLPAAQHDAAVSGHPPLRLNIRDGHSSATKRLRIKVRNADASGDLPIRLNAVGCSAAVATVDFDRRAPEAQDTTVVRAGRWRAAVVEVTVSSAGILTPDRHVPTTCLLTLTAAAAVVGNVDPSPNDNAADVELRVVDLNDVD